MAVAESTKIQWTNAVAAFEAMPPAEQHANGLSLWTNLQAAPHWQDARTSWFSQGWDSKQHLLDRVSRARREALRVVRGLQADGSVAAAAASGAGEGLAEGAANLAEAAKSAADQARKALPALPWLLVGAAALALFVRLRG